LNQSFARLLPALVRKFVTFPEERVLWKPSFLLVYRKAVNQRIIKKYYFNSHLRISNDLLKTKNREKNLMEFCKNTNMLFVIYN